MSLKKRNPLRNAVGWQNATSRGREKSIERQRAPRLLTSAYGEKFLVELLSSPPDLNLQPRGRLQTEGSSDLLLLSAWIATSLGTPSGLAVLWTNAQHERSFVFSIFITSYELLVTDYFLDLVFQNSFDILYLSLHAVFLFHFSQLTTYFLGYAKRSKTTKIRSRAN